MKVAGSPPSEELRASDRSLLPSSNTVPKRTIFLFLFLYAAVVGSCQLRTSMHTVRVTSLLKGALPSRGAQTAFRFPRLSQFRCMASVASEIPQSDSPTQRPTMATRQLTTTYATIAAHATVTATD